MKILHITPHMGGGVGTVIMGWMEKVTTHNDYNHQVFCMDFINIKVDVWADQTGFPLYCTTISFLKDEIEQADIVLVHYWDHPKLAELFSQPIPDCRMVFWCHQNFPVPQNELNYPDLFLDVSPVQGHGRHIWSTGGVNRFLAIQPKEHKGFNVGYVGTVDWKKIHPRFLDMCNDIMEDIPNVRFIIVGTNHLIDTQKPFYGNLGKKLIFTGQVDDVAPYLAEMDVFGYPLRPDHYGTSEQVLGEAMAAGVVPVVMDNHAERLIIRERFDEGYVANTPEKYIQLITALSAGSAGRSVVARNARNRAKILYSLDTMIRKWDEVFTEMMKQPKRKRNKP